MDGLVEGYYGELKLDGTWHSLWQFSDRSAAERFCKGRVFTQTEIEDFIATGHGAGTTMRRMSLAMTTNRLNSNPR